MIEEATELAALEPEQPEPIEPGTETSGEIAIPVTNPVKPEEPTLITALVPIEPETQNTGQIAIPQTNPERPEVTEEPVEVAALEPMDENLQSGNGTAFPIPNPQRQAEPEIENLIAGATEDEIILASIPIPQPKPSDILNQGSEIEVASLSRETSTLTPRSISLEKFSMPDLTTNTIGKWALAANSSIFRIADIRPPAYGRNAIRQLPSTVLTRGFTHGGVHGSADRFTGSSVEFLAFAKFE